MIGVLLYIQDAISLTELVSAGHDLTVAHQDIEIQEFPVEARRITVVRDGMYVFCKLIRRGDYADWFLDDAVENSCPFQPQAILSIEVSLEPFSKHEIALQLASETVGFFVQRWILVLDNDREKDKHRIYTREEIIANSREGNFPY